MLDVNRLAWCLLMVPMASMARAEPVDYVRDIKPLLAEKCSACHGALKQEAGLRLDHGEFVRRGSDDDRVIDVKNVAGSTLLHRVTAVDESMRMPPAGEGEPLTTGQIDRLRSWIAAGAQSPSDELIPIGPDQHWAWRVPIRPDIPASNAREFESRNPIDALIEAELQDRGLRPMPPADPRTRLRRLYYDVIGLPPTREQQQEFLADSAIDAWTRRVNQLLESPAYGERWARHWMDVWRYSDWDGYKQEVRGSQRHIWRWRDWIVESLNADKGYDQMVVEMLAGDEVAPTDPDVLRATGFLARNYHNSNRNIWLDATVEHTAKAFLGMTLNCARCHDHKYDPIRQQEYYSFRAIFEPHDVRTERLPGQPDVTEQGLVRAFDAEPDAPTYLFAGGNEKHADKDHPIPAATPEILGLPLTVTPIDLPGEAVFPALRPFVEHEELAAARSKIKAANERLEKLGDDANRDAFTIANQAVRAAETDLESLAARWSADKAKYGRNASDEWIAQARSKAVSAEHRAKIANARLDVLQRRAKRAEVEASKKDEDEKRSEVEKVTIELTEAQKKLDSLEEGSEQDGEYTPVADVYPAVSTGRRLALARWITRADNPVTARVAVNYIWMHHFGEPLVGNVFDFGLRSAEPPHRALLDWLSVELMQHDWSMKHIHRLILTSRTYQRVSSPDTDRADVHESSWVTNRQLDTDNRLFWRANVRRLDAEAVRDSLLHVSGNLDSTFGGPDIDFEKGEIVSRRSLYFRHAYEKQMTMLVVFDAAAPTECYRRSPSVVPQQALALANSPLALDQARALAAKLSSCCSQRSTDAVFIQNAFEVLLCRPCTGPEMRACTEFLQRQSALLDNVSVLTTWAGDSATQSQPARDSAQRARENLVHTLMNHNDFVTVR